ncbi:MAG: hypothetical protein CMF42_01350 [Legionellales bacterium]|nr:hypothetical protein [Legionellales bacterium]|tara:strand:- start:3875 stop:4129 length:255 start_codon:yes stop_codon:yes gene_type:complete
MEEGSHRDVYIGRMRQLPLLNRYRMFTKIARPLKFFIYINHLRKQKTAFENDKNLYSLNRLDFLQNFQKTFLFKENALALLAYK